MLTVDPRISLLGACSFVRLLHRGLFERGGLKYHSGLVVDHIPFAIVLPMSYFLMLLLSASMPGGSEYAGGLETSEESNRRGRGLKYCEIKDNAATKHCMLISRASMVVRI